MLTPPSTAAKSAKRRRAVLTLLGISVGWKVLVLTIGAAVPKWMIDDGVSAQPAELQPYARHVKGSARALWNGVIERHGVVRQVRVVSVERAAGTAVAPNGCGYGARVRAYTYFGVPYSEARMTCDSGFVEYRVFRGRGASAAAAPELPLATPVSPASARGSD